MPFSNIVFKNGPALAGYPVIGGPSTSTVAMQNKAALPKTPSLFDFSGIGYSRIWGDSKKDALSMKFAEPRFNMHALQGLRNMGFWDEKTNKFKPPTNPEEIKKLYFLDAYLRAAKRGSAIAPHKTLALETIGAPGTPEHEYIKQLYPGWKWNPGGYWEGGISGGMTGKRADYEAAWAMTDPNSALKDDPSMQFYDGMWQKRAESGGGA